MIHGKTKIQSRPYPFCFDEIKERAMKITVKEASEIVSRGDGDDYVKKFIGLVKHAVITENTIAINLSDSLIVATVLMALMEKSDYRILMKKPKRKNLQYDANKFSMFSPERLIARKLFNKEIFYNEAIHQLEMHLDKPNKSVDQRTIKRLLDDMLEKEFEFNKSTAEMLIAAGDDGSTESRERALAKIFSNLGYPVPGAAK